MYDPEHRINCHICRNIYCTCPPPDIDHADLAAMHQSRYSRKSSSAAASNKNYDKPWLQNSSRASVARTGRNSDDPNQSITESSSINNNTSTSASNTSLLLSGATKPKVTGKTVSATTTATLSARRDATKANIETLKKNPPPTTRTHPVTSTSKTISVNSHETDVAQRSSSVKLVIERESSSVASSSSNTGGGEKFHRANTSRPALPLSPPPQFSYSSSTMATKSSLPSTSTPPPKAKSNSAASSSSSSLTPTHRHDERSSTPTTDQKKQTRTSSSSSSSSHHQQQQRPHATGTAALTKSSTPTRQRSSTPTGTRDHNYSSITRTTSRSSSRDRQPQHQNQNQNQNQPLHITRQVTVTLDLEQTGRSLLVSTEREAATTLYLRWKAFKKEIQRDLELRTQLVKTRNESEQRQVFASLIGVLTESEAHGRKVVRELESDMKQELLDWYKMEGKTRMQSERKLNELHRLQQLQHVQSTSSSRNVTPTTSPLSNHSSVNNNNHNKNKRTTIVTMPFEDDDDDALLLQVSPESKMVSPVGKRQISSSSSTNETRPPLSPNKDFKSSVSDNQNINTSEVPSTIVSTSTRRKLINLPNESDDNDDDDSFTLSDTENDQGVGTKKKVNAIKHKKFDDIPVLPPSSSSNLATPMKSTPVVTVNNKEAMNSAHGILLSPSAAGNISDDVDAIAPKDDDDEKQRKESSARKPRSTSATNGDKKSKRTTSSRRNAAKAKKEEDDNKPQQQDVEDEDLQPNVEKMKLPSPTIDQAQTADEKERNGNCKDENAASASSSTATETSNNKKEEEQQQHESELPPILNPRAGWQQVVWSGGSAVANGVVRVAKVPFWCLRGVIGISAKPATIVNMESSDSELDDDEEQKEMQNKFKAKRTFDPAKDVIEKKEEEELKVEGSVKETETSSPDNLEKRREGNLSAIGEEKKPTISDQTKEKNLDY